MQHDLFAVVITVTALHVHSSQQQNSTELFVTITIMNSHANVLKCNNYMYIYTVIKR